MLPLFILLFLLVYVTAVLLIAFSLGLNTTTTYYRQDESLVSVVVVARNEDVSLPSLLHSFEELTYPRDKTEFILVDDRSGDGTADLFQNFSKGKRSCRIITIESLPEGRTGKMNGLDRALEFATGEFVFFTDADCIVPTGWIEGLLSYYRDDISMIAGSLSVNCSGKGCFCKFQALDWLLFSAVGSAAAFFGYPAGIFGNNFSIKKETLIRMGGFSSLDFSLTEDYALMRLVRNESRRSIRMIFNKNCQVYTHSLTNWSSFQLQRKRWALGTRGRDLLTYSLLVLALLAPILILILFISGNVSLSIASLSVLFAADLFLFSRILSLSGQMNLLIFVPLFRMFQIFYFLVLLPSFFWRNKIDWKESKYDATR